MSRKIVRVPCQAAFGMFGNRSLAQLSVTPIRVDGFGTGIEETAFHVIRWLC